MKNNVFEIKGACIRSWNLKIKYDDEVVPVINLTVDCKDYTLKSHFSLQMHDLVHILKAINIVNTKDITWLGCRVAMYNGEPIAIGGFGGRWVAFQKDGYYCYTSDRDIRKAFA